MTTIRIKHKSSYVTAYVFLTFIAILLIKSILNETIEKADLFGLTGRSTRTPTLAMPSAFSWPVLVPCALRAPAPLN
jgi:hypothetical protein